MEEDCKTVKLEQPGQCGSLTCFKVKGEWTKLINLAKVHLVPMSFCCQSWELWLVSLTFSELFAFCNVLKKWKEQYIRKSFFHCLWRAANDCLSVMKLWRFSAATAGNITELQGKSQKLHQVYTSFWMNFGGLIKLSTSIASGTVCHFSSCIR